MAKIEKSEESGPQLFFDFTQKYVSQLFFKKTTVFDLTKHIP